MSFFSLSAVRGCERVRAIPVSSILTVHSRFERSCNLVSCQGEWLTLLVCDMPLPPAGVVLATRQLPDALQPGSRWRWCGSTLQGGDCEIALTGCRWHSTCLTGERTLGTTLLSALDHFLVQNPPAGGFWAQWHGKARDYLTASLAMLGNGLGGREDELTPALISLLGYGHGLTPSGDDFLLGVLFALENQAHPRRDELIVALNPLLGRTTDISAAMLKLGAVGHYGERLLQLAAARGDDIFTAIEQVADYGHSSGHDMLCGVRYALSLARERAR